VPDFGDVVQVILIGVLITIAIIIFIMIAFSLWFIVEKMLIIRATRIEAEKNANVLVVTNNGQVFIRETNYKAWWRTAHLDARTYANGQNTYEQPNQFEVAAWNHFNRPTMSTQKALQLPATATTSVSRTLYKIIDTYTHLMFVGGTDSGKTTQINNAIKYLTKKNPLAEVIWLSTHAEVDREKIDIHSKALIIQEPGEIIKVLRAISKEHDLRYSDKNRKRYQIILALDEWIDFVRKYPEAGDHLKPLSNGGRKIKINLILGGHGTSVNALGIKGHS